MYFGIFEFVYFIVVTKQFFFLKNTHTQPTNHPKPHKQNLNNFQARLAVKKRQYNLELKHKPVLSDNGEFSVSSIMWKAEPCYESEIK